VLHTKYHSSDEIEKNEIGGACNTYGREKTRGEYRIMVGKPGVKRPRGRFRRRLEDNTNLNFEDVG